MSNEVEDSTRRSQRTLRAGLTLCAQLALAGSALAAPGPNLTVDVATARHAISDDIYGINFADEALATALRLPVRRWGGNSTSRYNWQANVHNTGSDYYFENIPDDTASGATLPNGSAADQFVDQDRRTGTRTLMTVPTIGWTPKRRLANHPYDCGFKVSKYGAQQSVDAFDSNCGNGIKPDTTNVTLNDPLDTSVAIDPSFVGAWINHLTVKYGIASNGGVAYYALDNEPALWNGTHRDVHPSPLTYDELRDRAWQYGAAVKAADPTARTLGPAEWGWCGYIYSAADPGGCGPGPDKTAHGNLDSVVWYLQQMQAYESAHGVRILDYLDLHNYPQADGVSLTTAGNAATQALRLRSTRSLWDPTYSDESYLSDLNGPLALQLIPRMKAWVAANYPGTRTAISEYNWGGLENVNGALAQADVLGIFGREGLDLATMWSPPLATEPGAFAFRMYRNYDGGGHGFGETSVSATSADQATLSIYAAQRRADQALTVIVINKSGNDLASPITLAGFVPAPAGAVYRYSGASPGTIARAADQALTASGFSATFPANSITLFVIAQASNPVRLANISTRMQVLTGNDVMIGGFVIGGSAGKTVAIVATGPSLGAFGIANPLANPTLTLVRSSDQTVIAANDDWQSASNAGQLQVAGFAPSNAFESAILINLPPGAYTAIVSGVGGGTGVGLVAVYEVDHPEVPLTNISTRGKVLTGNDVMIGGFVIQGSGPQQVAIVATGPSLAAFGIANPLADPTLTLVRSSDQTVIATNDNWQSASNSAQLQAAGFAPSNALESAILVTLQPGAYTAIVSGAGGGTGVGVVAVYTVP